MLFLKTTVVFFFLCFVHDCLSRPATRNEVTEGRGIMNSLWGFITYPFSWWRPEESEQPMDGQLLVATTNNPNIQTRSYNITIRCNDQTCNTLKCDKTQCQNITCSIYDTDFRGECRTYNIITTTTPIQDQPTETYKGTSVTNKSQEKDNNPSNDHPLNLGAVETTTKVTVPSKPTETFNETSLTNNSQEKANNPATEIFIRSTVNQTNALKDSQSKEDPTNIHNNIKV